MERTRQIRQDVETQLRDDEYLRNVVSVLFGYCQDTRVPLDIQKGLAECSFELLHLDDYFKFIRRRPAKNRDYKIITKRMEALWDKEETHVVEP